MVKFGKYLLHTAVPEWSAQYLDYKRLKKVLKKLKQAASGDAVGVAADDGPALYCVVSSAASSPEPNDYRVISNNRGGAFVVNLRSPMNRRPPDDIEERPQNILELLPAHLRFREIEEEFFALLQAELLKIVAFFRHQIVFFDRQIARLNDVDLLAQMQKSKRRAAKVRAGLRSLFQGLEFLQNFQVINYVGIAKILKKHDKTSSWHTSKDLIMPLLARYPELYPPVEGVTVLMKAVQEIHAKLFDGAHADSLRLVHRKLSHQVSFSAGVTFGLLLAMIGVIVTVFALNPTTGIPVDFLAAFPVFRGPLLLFVALITWGFNVALFAKKKINYGFILNASPDSLLQPNQMILLASTGLVLLLTTMTLFLVSTMFNTETRIAPGYFHLFAYVVFVSMLLCPFDLFYARSRAFFLRTCWQIAISPFATVHFHTFFMADYITSLVRVIYDFEYSICYYVTGSFLTHSDATCRASVQTARWVIAFLPYWWRFAQCCRRYHDTSDAHPHLPNAGKYFSAMLVILCNLLAETYKSNRSLLVLWAVASVFGTAYALSWDFLMDWGLFERHSPHRFLRSNITFAPSVYYAAMIANAFLRVTWVLTISPNTFGIFVEHDILLFLLSLGEILRRAAWSVLRIENEHLNNCGAFRVVKEIPLDVFGEPVKDHDEDDVDSPHGVDLVPEVVPAIVQVQEHRRETFGLDDARPSIRPSMSASNVRPSIGMLGVSSSDAPQLVSLRLPSTRAIELATIAQPD